jgi:prepilin-type N-terminal cleavage/methylation domain-containing protein
MRLLVKSQYGFSLVEVAVVLVVIGVLSAGAIRLLVVQRAQADIQATRTALEDAKESLFAYAQVNRGLPCAAPDGDGNAAISCTTTAGIRGLLPWRTLGLSPTQGTDANGLPLHYVVTQAFTVKLNANGSFNSTNYSTVSTAGAISIKDGGAYPISASAVAFAVWGVGPDTIDASAGEPAASTNVIYPSTATPADDVIVWGSRYVLVARVLQAGQLLELN